MCCAELDSALTVSWNRVGDARLSCTDPVILGASFFEGELLEGENSLLVCE